MKLQQTSTPGHFLFTCPGCKMDHIIYAAPAVNVPLWQWNGSYDKPTFQPSHKCSYPMAGAGQVCHSWITDGMIHFLDDSTHELKGQIVELPEWSDV